MPTYFARKTGNINAADVWATTPTGTAAAVTFVTGDVLVSNNFTIDVNVSVDLGASGQVRNDANSGATAGGFFRLGAGVTLTASAFSASIAVVQCLLSAPSSASFIGSLTQLSNGRGIDHAGTGTLTVTLLGNFTGSTQANSVGFYNGSTGVLNIVSSGNFTGGTGAVAAGNIGASPATINFTGNVTGGSSFAAISNSSTGLVYLIGTATGGAGAAGVLNSSTGTIRATRAVGNAFGPGNTAGLSAQVGIANSGLGVVEIEQLEYGTFGQSPTSGTGIRLRKVGSNVAVFNYCDTAGAKTLIDATQANQPAEADVRSGVSYASGARVGACAVPAAGSVAHGVPVGNATGTAVLTQSDVQSALTAQGLTSARAVILDNLDATVSSRLAPNGTLATVTNLTNAPASVTPSDIWSHSDRTLTSASGPTAVQIRQEIDANSTKLDAAISTRATPGNIPAADITAIKAKTDALNTTRLAQVATTELVGGLLAQANS